MIDFKRRSYNKELLDRDDLLFDDIRKNMQELNIINSRLGGHAITIKGFKEMATTSTVTICEIGCGGGDNLAALYRWGMKHNIKVRCIGIDINNNCIEWAKQSNPIPDSAFIVSDYKSVNFSEKPDIIFCSLFAHHFAEKELRAMMLWMQANSRLGFYINELHRHPIAYYFIKITTKLFSKSYLVKNDAPLSVLRGFKTKEWRSILLDAGIKNFTIHWKWAFRHLVLVKHI